ncbi:hypothetical protein JL475_36060 [Streptomyces sp. M2CJ-2]|nr:hypothetical protein [Streptomyces sp. M2CJ-2]
MAKSLVDGFSTKRTVSTRDFTRLSTLPQALCSSPGYRWEVPPEQGKPHRVDVSNSVLRFLTQQVRRHRRASCSRWRRLSAGRQALLALATCGGGHSTGLTDAVRTASAKADLILDGTLLPIDRVAPTGRTTSANTRSTG